MNDKTGSNGIITLKVPDIGESDKINIVQWHFKEGERFKAGDEICDLVTDKAAFSLEAPSSGQMESIICEAGSEVKVGDEVAKVLLEPDTKS